VLWTALTSAFCAFSVFADEDLGMETPPNYVVYATEKAMQAIKEGRLGSSSQSREFVHAICDEYEHQKSSQSFDVSKLADISTRSREESNRAMKQDYLDAKNAMTPEEALAFDERLAKIASGMSSNSNNVDYHAVYGADPEAFLSFIDGRCENKEAFLGRSTSKITPRVVQMEQDNEGER